MNENHRIDYLIDVVIENEEDSNNSVSSIETNILNRIRSQNEGARKKYLLIFSFLLFLSISGYIIYDKHEIIGYGFERLYYLIR